MPNMANITVKDSANADVVYTAATPSAGDRSPAVWRQNTPGVMNQRKQFSISTRDNAAGTARNFDVSFYAPVVATIGGVDTVVARIPLRASGTLPTNVDVDLVEDAFVQFGNLLVSNLIRSSIKEGFAPT